MAITQIGAKPVASLPCNVSFSQFRKKEAYRKAKATEKEKKNWIDSFFSASLLSRSHTLSLTHSRSLSTPCALYPMLAKSFFVFSLVVSLVVKGFRLPILLSLLDSFSFVGGSVSGHGCFTFSLSLFSLFFFFSLSSSLSLLLSLSSSLSLLSLSSLSLLF